MLPRRCQKQRRPRSPTASGVGWSRTPKPHGSPSKPWKYGVSEQPQHNRFLRQRQLPNILHPIEGGSTTRTSRSKRSADGGQGRFFIRPLMGRWPTTGITGRGVDSPFLHAYSRSRASPGYAESVAMTSCQRSSTKKNFSSPLRTSISCSRN